MLPISHPEENHLLLHHTQREKEREREREKLY
jgi:hypothetical protein